MENHKNDIKSKNQVFDLNLIPTNVSQEKIKNDLAVLLSESRKFNGSGQSRSLSLNSSLIVPNDSSN